MTPVIRSTSMTGGLGRMGPRHGNRWVYRECLDHPDLLQTLRENQRLLREITARYRMPRMPRTRHDEARARWGDGAPPTISCPQHVVTLLGEEMSTLVQEQLRIVLLDSKSRVLGCEVIYQGTIHSIAIRAAEVLRPALLANAPALIVVHNHPSGDPSPSSEDVRATEHLMAAGDLLDIDVLDHVVLGSGDRYVSLRERGLVSPRPDHPEQAAA